MARKRKPDSKRPNQASIKIDVALHQKCRHLAIDRDQALAEFFDEIIRPVIEKLWREYRRRVSEEETPHQSN
jgi:hypothetical protein